ncbi:molybdate ABC transporter substrate-binding protein [Nocardioides sp.]|uniref:molybdate ABC transporter substrate-binding protein n=1 Tax=Nocardioides sp. TaxID=35761 RepID=UPI003562A62D
MLVACLVGVLAGAGACSQSSSPGGDAGEPTLTVYAAASLTAPLTQIGARFEERHAGTRVRFNFDGSSGLAAQIRQGAPADVFASADETTMEGVDQSGLLAGTPVAFATNTLQIAVQPENPLGITSLADLTGSGINLVICAPVVPCGAAATAAADVAGVELRPVSEEQSVTDVLAKVRSGEADAGLVYVTDVLGADGDVLGIDFPEASAAVNTYSMAVLAGASEPELARAFEDFVLAEGRAVLVESGFGPP